MQCAHDRFPNFFSSVCLSFQLRPVFTALTDEYNMDVLESNRLLFLFCKRGHQEE
jgi:hypothetical protein